MPARSLQELLSELEATLNSGSVSQQDRILLERVQADLTAAHKTQPATAQTTQTAQTTAIPHTLPDNLREAIDRLQVEHPKLSSVLSNALNALSDLGV